MKNNFKCAVNLVVDIPSLDIYENEFWLFFETEEEAKQVVCNKKFGRKHNYPTYAIFCDIIINDDGIYITDSSYMKNEVYYFDYLE